MQLICSYIGSNGSFEKNGRQAFYPTHHADPLRAEANDRTNAPRTRTRAHEPHGRPYAYMRCVSHISSTMQHMCTFLQAWHTKRVTTFLNTASTMHELHTADRTNHAPRGQAFSALEMSSGGPV